MLELIGALIAAFLAVWLRDWLRHWSFLWYLEFFVYYLTLTMCRIIWRYYGPKHSHSFLNGLADTCMYGFAFSCSLFVSVGLHLWLDFW